MGTERASQGGSARLSTDSDPLCPSSSPAAPPPHPTPTPQPHPAAPIPSQDSPLSDPGPCRCCPSTPLPPSHPTLPQPRLLPNIHSNAGHLSRRPHTHPTSTPAQGFSVSACGFFPHYAVGHLRYRRYVTYLRHGASHLRCRMSDRTYDIVRTIFRKQTYDIAGTISYVSTTS